MRSFDKAFERKWLLIFAGLYVLIMLPFPFFYSTTYIPSIAGIPLFIFGWFIHTAVTFLFIYLYYKQAMQRKEYADFEGKEE